MKGILFNTEMVRAILDGRKTVTRRVVKDAEKYLTCDCGAPFYRDPENGVFYCEKCKYPLVADGVLFLRSPYSPGDILYVRETFAKPYGGIYRYKADYHDHDIVEADIGDVSVSANLIRWSPSIHMPREAARIFLRVTDVRVERLQDITAEQIVKEGISREPLDEMGEDFFKGMFHDLWDSTIKHADRALYGWEANPWVWVIEFERIRKEEAEHGMD